MKGTDVVADRYKNKIITIPNILSMLRLAMIPLFVISYSKKADYKLTAAILALSGVTDIVDGMIARRFCMISDLGKALDPIADKLTQIAMLGCLLSRFPRMAIPFFVLIAKEALTGFFSLLAIRKTKVVYSAKWYGKITTVFLYGMMIVHVLWFDIPTYWSNVLISVCLFCMVVSFTLYMSRNIQIIKQS